MTEYYEHRGITIEIFYFEDGTCYSSFDINNRELYETDTHETAKQCISEAMQMIDEILEELN